MSKHHLCIKQALTSFLKVLHFIENFNIYLLYIVYFVNVKEGLDYEQFIVCL